jgi:hypothetical protein
MSSGPTTNVAHEMFKISVISWPTKNLNTEELEFLIQTSM